MTDDGLYLSIEQHETLTIYTFHAAANPVIDEWFAHISQAMNSSFSILMDVSSPQVGFTRYARQKSSELFEQHRQSSGRIAFLFTSKIAPHFARIYFASLGKLGFEVQFFSDKQKALNWLMQNSKGKRQNGKNATN